VCSTIRTPLLDPTGRYSSRYYQQRTNFSEALKANFLELRQREARRTPLPRTNPRPEVRYAQSGTQASHRGPVVAPSFTGGTGRSRCGHGPPDGSESGSPPLMATTGRNR
jgi:hypothetical protein